MHGPVFATATVDGEPYALSRKRSTFGRDALNLGALKDMTEGERQLAAALLADAPTSSASPSTGATCRASSRRSSPPGCFPGARPGLDRRLPTLGDGRFEWNGFLSESEHPHDTSGPGGLLLNWNNQSAPGFMHGDDEPYGSVQRVEMFDRVPAPRAAHRRRRGHEPRRDRGRALAGLAGRQPRAAHGPGAQRPRRRRSSPCSTTGCAATPPASTPTATASTTRPGR